MVGSLVAGAVRLSHGAIAPPFASPLAAVWLDLLFVVDTSLCVHARVVFAVCVVATSAFSRCAGVGPCAALAWRSPLRRSPAIGGGVRVVVGGTVAARVVDTRVRSTLRRRGGGGARHAVGAWWWWLVRRAVGVHAASLVRVALTAAVRRRLLARRGGGGGGVVSAASAALRRARCGRARRFARACGAGGGVPSVLARAACRRLLPAMRGVWLRLCRIVRTVRSA